MATTIAKRAKSEPHSRTEVGPLRRRKRSRRLVERIPDGDGTRYARSITFARARFRDRKTDEWRDGAYRPVDLPALLLAIEAAHDFCLSTPLPGEPAEQEEVDKRGQSRGINSAKSGAGISRE